MSNLEFLKIFAWPWFDSIHDLVLKEKIDIICLQETHLKYDKNHKDVLKFEKIFNEYNFYYIKTEKSARGVAILIKSCFYSGKPEYINYYEDRFLEIRIRKNGRKISIFNIYSPNDYNLQIEYVEKLYELCRNNHYKILCGDFNSSELSEKKHERIWKDFLNDFNFKQVSNNKAKISYTWDNGKSKSKIDRIYISNKN